jgi:hypothetical protein
VKILVRAFVVALVLTGAVASTQTASATSKDKVVAARTSMLPVPMCPPDDPKGCGIGSAR